jgi:hypothetical protein
MQGVSSLRPQGVNGAGAVSPDDGRSPSMEEAADAIFKQGATVNVKSAVEVQLARNLVGRCRLTL